MTIREAVALLRGELLCGQESLDEPIMNACGADMMSDVLAFVKDHSLLLTGLVNPQVVRTADMMDMRCIVFVRGKCPTPDILSLARSRGIAVAKTPYRMFSACGILYAAGLRGLSDDCV